MVDARESSSGFRSGAARAADVDGDAPRSGVPGTLPSVRVAHQHANIISLVSVCSLVVCVAIIELASSLPSSMSVTNLEAIAPTLITSMTFLSIYYVGYVDIELGGVVSLVTVGLALAISPSDLRVLVIVLLAAIFGAARALVLARATSAALVSILLYVVLRNAATAISPDGPRTVSFDNSLVLRGLTADIGGVQAGVWVAAIVAIISWVLLGRTQLGLQMRANGVTTPGRPEFSLRVSIIAHLSGVLLVALAAMTELARTGTGSPLVGDGLVIDAATAFVLGNGGLRRWNPAPLRILIVTLSLVSIRLQLVDQGWSAAGVRVALGALAMAVIVIEQIANRDQS